MKKWWCNVFVWLAMNLLLTISCQAQLGNYTPIPGVTDEINALGRKIAQYQRDEVWTGGNEYSGAYTWNDYDKFQARGGAAEIADRAQETATFIIDGVTALGQLPVGQQNEILESWRTPIDPTWAQTGRIGNGTTEAGQLAEREIAEALTDLVQEMLALHDG